MKQEILVLCPLGLDTGLLSKAAELSESVRVLIPKGAEAQAAAHGASVIHVLPAQQTEEENNAPSIGDEAAFARYLAEKVTQWGSQIILAPATVRMRSIMPMLAWHLDAGLTADCTALTMEGDALIQTRPAFGNSLMAAIRSLSKVQMATVRPGTFRAVEKPANPQIIYETYAAEETVKALSFQPFTGGKPLSQADIIIAGGMGVGSKEGFRKLERLADKLGAGIAASRTAVDAGFAPFRCQVGLTGVTVCPRLYIAVGISGAVQHLAGMSGSERIIAINNDPKAPIFDYADYGVVADWEAVIDQLLEESL